MKRHAIASRYSKVMFNLDVLQEDLIKRLSSFKAVEAILEANPQLVKVLNSPQIPLEEKKRILEKVLGEHADPRFIQFILYLIERKRLDYLHIIAGEYRQRVDDHLGIWEAEITTAVPMDPRLEARLKEKLENHFHRKVMIKKKVHPEIIGGAILVVNNSLIDWSVLGRLNNMKAELPRMKK